MPTPGGNATIPTASDSGADVTVEQLEDYERSTVKESLMKALEIVGLNASRAAIERALDAMDWATLKGKYDVFPAVFRAAFR